MAVTFTQNHLSLLQVHLKAIVDVEFFTIPFYLTAAYSFTSNALDYFDSSTQTKPLFNLQQKTVSVAVQEMYHLQLASNLANAFGVTPEIPQLTLIAGQEIVVPHLDPAGNPLTTQLGNLPEVIKAMIAVETPDPDHTYPQPNSTATYPSIGDLYYATLTLLKGYDDAFKNNTLDPEVQFIPDHYQVAYGGFLKQYTYNAIKVPGDVIQAATAIVDQGEGSEISVAIGAPFRPENVVLNDTNDVPQAYWSTGSRFDDYNKVTHFKRFEDIQQALNAQDWESVIGGPVFYTSDGQASTDLPAWAKEIGYQNLQDYLNIIWSYLINTMQAGFADGSLSQESSQIPGFNEAMLAFKYIPMLIWQMGYCPSFAYQESGATADDAKKAMYLADPFCLFHWDPRTIEVRNQFDVLNACQGLNQCKGQGWGGIATQAGDGACATAEFHTCSAGNSCKYQGGCGFLVGSTPTPEDWIPGENQGKNDGGCQTPISSKQVFDRTVKGFKPDLSGTPVWNEARILFQQRQKLANLPTPLTETIDGITYDGTARRSAVSATSK